MKYRAATVAGLLALAVAAVYLLATFLFGGDDTPSASSGDTAVVAPPAPAPEQPAAAIRADPDPDAEPGDLVLTGPAEVQPDSSVTFGIRWSTSDGQPVDGKVDLQRIERNRWATLTTAQVKRGVGEVEVQVPGSGVYRLAYGGSDEVAASASHELVVIAGAPLPSRLIATAEDTGDGLGVTAAWTTTGGVPIIGRLGLQQAAGEAWDDVSTAVTGKEGTTVVELGAEESARFRFSYPGGARFAAVVSDAAVALGDDIQAIPVELCDDDADIDSLPAGVGCHYTPVTAGTFVVGHDYLDNAWWNSIPIGSYVELTGEQAGVYEVVDRVIAPGRGAALGPASNWTCDGECDIILQTCQGSNTGFTWLREVPEGRPG